MLKSEDHQKTFFHYDSHTQPVEGSKRRDRKDHLTTMIRMFFLDSCNQEDKSKVILVVILSQSRAWYELKCRNGRETKSEQVQATVEPKPELHPEIPIGLILVY